MMNNEIQGWIAVLFLVIPALLYAALVIHDMKKREQKEKKS